MKYSVRRTLVYLLIFTVVASFLAYRMVVKGYEVTYDTYAQTLAQD